nr:NACHT domain-containing protein [Phenylobacterium sp.]
MPVEPPTLAIFAPPDSIVSVPPVATRVQLLPFEALAWENFERLCHRMTAIHGDVEYCARYGSQGEAQEGIDIYARLANGRYHCLQAKRHKNFGATKLRKAVDLFIAGGWAQRAERFTLAVQASLRSTAVQNEIEHQKDRLAALGISFEAPDGEQLTDRLRDQPRLIDDFFGRAWVTALLGENAATALGARLDGEAFARVRAQLARVYEAQFHFVDPGSFGSIGDEDSRPGLTLLERFEIPDMLMREIDRPVERVEIAGGQEGQDAEAGKNGAASASPDSTRGSAAAAGSRVRRVPLGEWFGEEDRLVVLGDAGSGKSTLLRVAALDILHGRDRIPEIGRRWGQLLPVYVPFARWSSQAARDGHAIGIKEIIRRSLEPLMTASIVDLIDRAIDEGRVLLLIDGLDEWSSEQSARATLSALVTTVEAHAIPAILSGRPRGLARIGAIPASWKRGTVAPLAIEQQAAIAGRWFRRYSPDGPDPGAVSEAQLRTGRFMAELARDANLSAFATAPLLLVGLVTLALRGQILPRTRADIYDQLVRVLLEIHPDSRATASGDTEPRFRHARDPDQRRAAIARLAFAVREEAGGAGMPTVRAREILRDYMASSEGCDVGEPQAAAAAFEILAVNAETQGLIVEKAQGEVGFVHAGFEEYLGAEHIGGWPFARIEAFVQDHAGDGRWRNVLANLVARIPRRDEIDRLVAIVDARDCDEVALFHRQALLGDIAFGTVTRAPATARRLALGTIERVEADDWMPARREALASALKGIADPALRPDVEARIGRWLPARLSRRAPLVWALRRWSPSDALAQKLWQAMHDEDRSVQRTAAAAYADRFASDDAARHRLISGLEQTRDVHA